MLLHYENKKKHKKTLHNVVIKASPSKGHRQMDTK